MKPITLHTYLMHCSCHSPPSRTKLGYSTGHMRARVRARLGIVCMVWLACGDIAVQMGGASDQAATASTAAAASKPQTRPSQGSEERTRDPLMVGEPRRAAPPGSSYPYQGDPLTVGGNDMYPGAFQHASSHNSAHTRHSLCCRRYKLLVSCNDPLRWRTVHILLCGIVCLVCRRDSKAW